MVAIAKQGPPAPNVKPKTELQRLRHIERLAKWAVEREAALSVAEGRSNVLRLFAEEVRNV
ncbi:MAG: hypothetical protein V4586_14770 [Pseudomonadota bacterium]